MALHQINFDHVNWHTNQTVTFPMSVTLGNASSSVNMGVGGNSTFTGATTGLVNTADQAAAQLRFNGYGFESLNSSNTALGTLVGGTGASSTDVEFSGISSNQPISGSSLTASGAVQGSIYKTASNCASPGGTCGSSGAGAVTIAASATTVTVAATNLTANSEIFIQEDSSLGTRLSVTCNTTAGRTYTVTSRTAGTSFVITTSAAPITNPACLNYHIIN